LVVCHSLRAGFSDVWPTSDRRLLIVLIALPVLSAFALGIVAILIAFGNSFE
jgi:hypothetical protein